MATMTITEDNLNETVEGNDLVVLDFWAAWCQPCMHFGPVFEQVSEKHPDIVFGKINVDEQQQLSGAAGISSIPTLMIFREQVPVFTHSGALTATALEDLISQVKALDMDDIRRQIAEAKNQ